MNICIYGASSAELKKIYYEKTEELGQLMGKRGHGLVFGGGKEGLMGAAARGVDREKGYILGIAPRFFDQPGVLYEHCTEFIFTENMRERKHLLESRSDATIVVPGGIGTYEEFFEILTLKSLGRSTGRSFFIIFRDITTACRHSWNTQPGKNLCPEMLWVCAGS